MQPFSIVRKNSSATGENGYEMVMFEKNRINCFIANIRYCEPHWHEAAELLVVIRGRFSVNINHNQMMLAKGDMLYIQGNELHSLDALEEHSTLLTIQFSPSLFSDIRYSISDSFILAGESTERVRAVRSALSALLLHCRSAQGNADFKKLQLIYAVLQVLDQAFLQGGQVLPVKSDGGRNDLMLVKAAISYINEHYMQPIDMQALAGRLGISYHYFSRIFKRVSFYGFKEFVIYLRVNRARLLLTSSLTPITEISYSCGFSEHKQLISAFKKHFMQTPSEYRKEYARQTRDYQHLDDFLCRDMSETELLQWLQE